MIRLTTPPGTPGVRPARGRSAAWVRGHSSDGLEHHGVAVGERRGDRARAEDHRRVPRRDADDDADRLADAHARAARARRRGSPRRSGRVGLGGRLAQHPGGEVAVEHAPAERRRRSPRSSSRRSARERPPAAGRRRALSSARRSPGGGWRPRRERGRGRARRRACGRRRGRRRRPGDRSPVERVACCLELPPPEPRGTHSPPISSRCCSSSTVVMSLLPPCSANAAMRRLRRPRGRSARSAPCTARCSRGRRSSPPGLRSRPARSAGP